MNKTLEEQRIDAKYSAIAKSRLQNMQEVTTLKNRDEALIKAAKERIRLIYRWPHKELDVNDGSNLYHNILRHQKPIEEWNNQRAWTLVYLYLGKRYEVSLFPFSEPIIVLEECTWEEMGL